MHMSNQFRGCYSLSMVASQIQRIFLMYNTILIVPLSMFSHMFCFVDLQIHSHTKKNHQGNDNSNRSPLDLYQVHHDIQNTVGFW